MKKENQLRSRQNSCAQNYTENFSKYPQTAHSKNINTSQGKVRLKEQTDLEESTHRDMLAQRKSQTRGADRLGGKVRLEEQTHLEEKSDSRSR
jgi:hypothetical protein